MSPPRREPSSSFLDLVDAAPAPIDAPLTGDPLDRRAAARAQPEALRALAEDPRAALLALWGGKPPIDLGDARPKLAWTPLAETIAALTSAGVDPSEVVFLGVSEDGAPRFALDVSTLEDPTASAFWPGRAAVPKHIDLRSISPELGPGEPAMLAQAKALLEWHANHPFCSKCGAATRMGQGGWRRECDACGARHFPRTDPVVIMLVVRVAASGEESVLLGRQSHWPPRMHSLLAGYVEPGETIEEAVRRETWEEAGVRVGRVGYLATQPWPFPSTLMIGCWAEALTDEIAPQEDELESLRWATKAEARAALDGVHPEFDAPRVDAIARSLVEAWALDRLTPQNASATE